MVITIDIGWFFITTVVANLVGLLIWNFFRSGRALRLGRTVVRWLTGKWFDFRHWLVKHGRGYWIFEERAINCDGSLTFEPDQLTFSFSRGRTAVVRYDPLEFLQTIQMGHSLRTHRYTVSSDKTAQVRLSARGVPATAQGPDYEVEVHLRPAVQGADLLTLQGLGIEQQLHFHLSQTGKMVYLRD